MPFDTSFSVIKRYFFHYFTKSAPIPGKQGSFEILLLFHTWRYRSLVLLFFSSIVILIFRWFFFGIAEQFSFRRSVTSFSLFG